VAIKQPNRDVHDLFDRTLTVLLARLSNPLLTYPINYLFNAKYPPDSEVIRENTEEIDDELGKKQSDSKLRVRHDRFIIEAEIAPNKPVAIKIFREAFEDAVSRLIDDDGVITLPFPDVCVIYFEPNEQTPDEITVRLKTQDGRSLDYPIRSFKPSELSVKELAEHKLLLCLPFMALKFRKRLEKCKTDEERAPFAEEMRWMLTGMVEAIEEPERQGAITRYDAYTLLTHIDNIWEQLYGEYPDIREVDVMVVNNQLKTRWDILMDEAVEQAVEQAREDERIRTREDDRRKFEAERRNAIITMKKAKIDDDEIAKAFNIPIAEVRQIQA
jgi:hypothetical protein